ncbi:CpaF family protein [Alicyclobacillus sp. ALC3]|uniref:CpaF family protein n=1 Tax=Alicyclobacillus sp. ALC3 TaxID=2796143 RepID=UPI002378E95D|nr:CpaF family protein [Alicyclobacillus sp. ALC3]WDL95315.1 CpaF family protein [Alicyclobacillus sp. ALC3]
MSLLDRLEKEKAKRQGSFDGRGTVPVETFDQEDEARERPTKPSAPSAPDIFEEWKIRLHQQLVEVILDSPGNEEDLDTSVQRIIEEADPPLSRSARERMAVELKAEALGYGPIDGLLNDDGISEVMVNGPKKVYVERSGKLELTNITFLNDAHVMRIIEKIVAPLGRRIDESSPMVDARLADGSRVNAIIPPLALSGPTITIRKFAKDPYQAKDLIRFGTLTAQMSEFLEACVSARLNVLVSGGTGSGKTTTLNVISSFIPHYERVVTIEDAAELQLHQDHVVTLETRPPNIEGRGAITIRDLVKNSLRMRPDRIVVGEVRSGEALDMLQAMNTGHDGSLTTVHANTPRDSLRRLEVMVLMAGIEMPVRAIREQIASAIDVVVQQARLRDGARKIIKVSEVIGMEGENIVLQDIYSFDEYGRDENGKVQGKHVPTGIVPSFIERLRDQGYAIDFEWFQRSEESWR